MGSKKKGLFNRLKDGLNSVMCEQTFILSLLGYTFITNEALLVTSRGQGHPQLNYPFVWGGGTRVMGWGVPSEQFQQVRGDGAVPSVTM